MEKIISSEIIYTAVLLWFMFGVPYFSLSFLFRK